MSEEHESELVTELAPEPQSEPQPEPEVSQNKKHIEIIDNWWESYIRGSIAGRNTEVWNYLHTAVKTLKTMLDQV